MVTDRDRVWLRWIARQRFAQARQLAERDWPVLDDAGEVANHGPVDESKLYRRLGMLCRLGRLSRPS